MVPSFAICSKMAKKFWCSLFALTIIIGSFYFVITNIDPVAHFILPPPKEMEFTEDYLQEVLKQEPMFLLVNNETGFSEFIVPNIVHFIRIQQPKFTFVDLVVVLAVYKHQKPDKIWIHCDACEMTGVYWEKAKRQIPIIELKRFQPPTEIYGKEFANVWHSGDVARIQILQKYGGIFLDNDVYVVRSLDEFRKFEMTAGWDEGQFIGTQILIAHPSARYLRLWYESYKDYQGDRWYYNAGELPTKAILWKHPEILHRIKKWFGVDVDGSLSLYKKNDIPWHEFYTFHLLLRHVALPSHIKIFNESNIKNYDTAFGQMARLVYYGSEDLILRKNN